MGEIGAVLAVLAAVFFFGRLWFHLVEGVLDRIRRLLFRRKEPPAWHPLPPEPEEESAPGEDRPK